MSGCISVRQGACTSGWVVAGGCVDVDKTNIANQQVSAPRALIFGRVVSVSMATCT